MKADSSPTNIVIVKSCLEFENKMVGGNFLNKIPPKPGLEFQKSFLTAIFYLKNLTLACKVVIDEV